MESPVTLSHLTLSDPERWMLRCWIWSKIDTCIVRYCVRVNLDFNWFSRQQWVFDSLQKIANVIPTAAVKQSAKVLGPPVIFWFIAIRWLQGNKQDSRDNLLLFDIILNDKTHMISNRWFAVRASYYKKTNFWWVLKYIYAHFIMFKAMSPWNTIRYFSRTI